MQWRTDAYSRTRLYILMGVGLPMTMAVRTSKVLKGNRDERCGVLHERLSEVFVQSRAILCILRTCKRITLWKTWTLICWCLLTSIYLHTYLPPLPSQTILPSSQTISRRRMDHSFSATHSSDQSGNSRKIRLWRGVAHRGWGVWPGCSFSQ